MHITEAYFFKLWDFVVRFVGLGGGQWYQITVFHLRAKLVSLELAFSSHCLLIFPAFLGCRTACVVFASFPLQTREASSVVGAASVSLLFSLHCFVA